MLLALFLVPGSAWAHLFKEGYTVYIWEERPRFLPVHFCGMSFAFLFVRYRENAMERISAGYGTDQYWECFWRSHFFASRVKWADNCNTCTKHWNPNAWVISIYTVYVHILFLVLLFHLNISTVKKDSGFEIVENKCIFVHQSYTLDWAVSLWAVYLFCPQTLLQWCYMQKQNKKRNGLWQQIFIFHSWLSPQVGCGWAKLSKAVLGQSECRLWVVWVQFMSHHHSGTRIYPGMDGRVPNGTSRTL